jgi:hypothetical protein
VDQQESCGNEIGERPGALVHSTTAGSPSTGAPGAGRFEPTPAIRILAAIAKCALAPPNDTERGVWWGTVPQFPGISTRPDPPPASKRSSGSYEEVVVRLGILGNFWGLSFSTRAMRAHFRAERVPLSALRVEGEEIPKIPKMPTCCCTLKS